MISSANKLLVDMENDCLLRTLRDKKMKDSCLFDEFSFV